MSFYPKDGKFGARVTLLGKVHWLGYFDTAEEAGEAATAKRRELGFLEGNLNEWYRYAKREKTTEVSQ